MSTIGNMFETNIGPTIKKTEKRGLAFEKISRLNLYFFSARVALGTDRSHLVHESQQFLKKISNVICDLFASE